MFYNSTYYDVHTKVKFMETEQNGSCQALGKGGTVRNYLKNKGFQFGKMTNRSADGWWRWLHNNANIMALICTLKAG